MNPGAQASAGSSLLPGHQARICKARAGGVLVGAHDGALDRRLLEVSICRRHRETVAQGTACDPAAGAAFDDLVVTEILRQVALTRPAAGPSEQRIDEQPVAAAWSAPALAPASNQTAQLRPLMVTQPVHVATRRGLTQNRL